MSLGLVREWVHGWQGVIDIGVAKRCKTSGVGLRRIMGATKSYLKSLFNKGLSQ